MQTTADTTSGYVAIAALIVAALAHFGIVANPADVIAILGGLVSGVSLIKLIVNHNKVVSAARIGAKVV